MEQLLIFTQSTPGLGEAVRALPRGWKVEVLDATREGRQRLRSYLPIAKGIVVHQEIVDEEFLTHASQLKVVVKYGVGLDNIDLDCARRRGVTVSNLPFEVTYSTAELTMALMLACSRRIPEADRWLRNHVPFVWTPENLLGNSLCGKTLGIVGLGRIGRTVADMACAFGMSIVYCNRSSRKGNASLENMQLASLQDLVATVDIVSLHVPGGPDTHHLISRRELSAMKREAIVINTSRGTVIDETVLVEFLQNRRIAAAGLDVFENEPSVHTQLLSLDNVVLTPHLGTSTLETRELMTRSAVQLLIRGAQGIT